MRVPACVARSFSPRAKNCPSRHAVQFARVAALRARLNLGSRELRLRQAGPGRGGVMRNRACAVLLAVLAAACLALAPLKDAGAGTTSEAPGLITSSDPSACTVSKANPAQGMVGMNPRGLGHAGDRVNAWLFKASCGSGANSIEIRVHPDFTETEAASVAEKIGKDIGRLPKVLRTGIKPGKGPRILSIHKGEYTWFATDAFGHVRIYQEHPKVGSVAKTPACAGLMARCGEISGTVLRRSGCVHSTVTGLWTVCHGVEDTGVVWRGHRAGSGEHGRRA